MNKSIIIYSMLLLGYREL